MTNQQLNLNLNRKSFGGMKNFATTLRQKPWFETLYKISVAIKGFDGLVELVAGITLWISPSIIHSFLGAIVGETAEHSGRIMQFISENVARIDDELAKSGLTFLILFLTIHGLVKLALVYCLLKEIVRAYPVALAILVVFLIYQLYVFIVHPTIGMALFTLLDAIIIWIVWGEYQDLKSKK